MRWEIHDDGSFDLLTEFGALRGMWPGVDHRDIRCREVVVEGNRIAYHLAEGLLVVELGEWEHGLSVGCELRGATVTPHWLHPLHGGRIEGLQRLFRQGIGFSGPTGIVAIDDAAQMWSYESYLLAGLLDHDERTLVVAPHEHREFLYKAQVYNRLYRHNFRNREIESSLPLFEAGYRTERIESEGILVLPPLYFSEGDGLFDTLRAAADHIARANGVAFDKAPRYHYCSAYYHGPNFTRALLDNLLDGLDKVDPGHQLQTVQIDDWYMSSHGDWLTFKEHLWPGGLKPAFERVKRAGYTPGVWVAPFMVGSASKLAAEHPDWLLHRPDGSLVVEWKHYRGEASPDFEHYVLDTSHPDAMAWVAEVFSTFRKWGVRFFKTDFLEWGYRDSTTVARYTPGKTGARYFDDAMYTIREAIGADSYWLGCITYFAPSIGYMDGMRVSSDVGNVWQAVGGIGNDGVGGGIPNMLQESFATLYMNNVLWQNDPDVVFMRDRHTHLTEPEFRSLAAWHALLGHSVNTSAQLGELSEKRLAWWRWMRPQKTPWTARLPYFGKDHPLRVAVRDYPDANGEAVLVLNEQPQRSIAVLPLRELTGQRRATVYRWG
ncbi:MAG: hypothetical protein GF331_23535, partial [Chitinivibrionales bacterium]|nr:hypothetical protein [Chitinivibrionales bacterium]